MYRHIVFILSLLASSLSISAQQIDLSLFENLNIRNVGPANMSGRITAIDAVTANPKIIVVGAASGGVWRSDNGGSAWTPIFDSQPTQNIGAVAIQQDNPSVIWVGTGEGNPRNSMNLGMGIFRSLDGGQTWQHLGLEATKTIHRIIIHPDDPDVVFVGAMGDPFTPNAERGLYRTTDGGQTWEQILYTNDQSGVADLIIDPTNPNKLIAAMYDHRRTPYSYVSGGPGSGMYMTYDGGNTWTQLTTDHGLPEGKLGRIGLAIAPSDPDRLYAKIEATQNKLYRSDDGGHSWYVINDQPRYTNNRPFYFQELAVDSQDPNRLYNICQPLWVSYDGGKTFDPTPMIPADETKGIHADFHAFWVNPRDPHHFIIGGDGGLGITYDHGKSWYFPENIPVAQFYHINADNDHPYNIYGGMQDNGNWYGPGYVWKRGGIRTLYWQYLVGGDGFYIAPDVEDSRFGYGTSQNGDLYRYDKVSGYYSSIKPHSEIGSEPLRFHWNAAFAKDPHDEEALYYGSQYVHKTSDKGATWQIISPDLTTNNPNHQQVDYGGLTLDVSGAETYNTLLAIAPSPIDRQVIWTGSDDGQVYITRDGGQTWDDLTGNIKGMPDQPWIARIKASPYDAASAWMVVNNYRKGDYLPYLYKTEDYGKTWQEMTAGSDVRGYALSFAQDIEEPRLVFLGTEHGLWISIDEGRSWVQYRNGYPSVSTMDLKIQESESALIVGTFGRAIWILDDLHTLRAAARQQLSQPITAITTNEVVQVKGLFIAPPGNIWSGFHTTFQGENRVFQKMEVPYFLASPTDTSVVVEAHIFDENNQLINTISAKPDRPGLNHLIWKLDHAEVHLPGAWIHDETRGTPVLPGEYRIVISHGDHSDESMVRIIPDPRFDLDHKVDEELHRYQRRVDTLVVDLSTSLKSIDNRHTQLEKLEDFLTIHPENPKNLKVQIALMRTQLHQLKDKGRTPRPDRQIGAWGTTATSPYSRVNDVQMIAMSRVRAISSQEHDLLDEAADMVYGFSDEVSEFMRVHWAGFIEKIADMDLGFESLIK